MKYSIRGNLNMSDGSAVVGVINKYPLWRLITSQSTDPNNVNTFSFEAWVNTDTDKNGMFNDLKPIVDASTGSIDWHNCTHDEPIPQSCTVVETYRK
jgi:hypothetical protein